MRHFLLHILLSALLLLAACGTPNQPPTPTPQPSTDISGKLSEWTLGEANLRGTFTQTAVAQGKLKADGSFDVDFETAIPTEALNNAPSCNGLDVSDKNAKQNTFSALSVIIKGEKQGVIALASSSEAVTRGLNEVGDFYVQYTYVDRDLNIKGDCPLSNPPATFSYDMALKKGWNTVVFGLSQKNANGSQVLSMKTGAVPDAAAWFYRP